MVEAICKELDIQKYYMGTEIIQTIYFGGGTPSILSIEQIIKITTNIFNNYTIAPDAEFTFEANPDNLNKRYLKQLFNDTPVNRLSIGVQSFNDKELKLLNRSHNAIQANNVITESINAGFTNINIDLIYGIPGQEIKDIKYNLHTIGKYPIQHISAYLLTIEPKTVFGRWQKKGRFKAANDAFCKNAFYLVSDSLQKQKFNHYEISNFAKKGFISKHNSSYWAGEKYLGIGPSAHSYNTHTRHWNVAINTDYINRIMQGELPGNVEKLNERTKFNEYILTSLRTMWGINLDFIKKEFSQARFNLLLNDISYHIKQKNILHKGNTLKITKKGKILVDRIISDAMWVD